MPARPTLKADAPVSDMKGKRGCGLRTSGKLTQIETLNLMTELIEQQARLPPADIDAVVVARIKDLIVEFTEAWTLDEEVNDKDGWPKYQEVPHAGLQGYIYSKEAKYFEKNRHAHPDINGNSGRQIAAASAAAEGADRSQWAPLRDCHDRLNAVIQKLLEQQAADLNALANPLGHLPIGQQAGVSSQQEDEVEEDSDVDDEADFQDAASHYSNDPDDDDDVVMEDATSYTIVTDFPNRSANSNQEGQPAFQRHVINFKGISPQPANSQRTSMPDLPGLARLSLDELPKQEAAKETTRKRKSEGGSSAANKKPRGE